MNINEFTITDVRNIAGLLRDKESLETKLAEINAQLASYDGGGPVAVVDGRSAWQPGKPPRRKLPSSASRRARKAAA
jgi:hypothetical protein